MSTLNLQPPRVPLVDPATGVITREWYRYITDSFVRQGGHDAPTNTDVDVAMPEDSGVAELEMHMRAIDNSLSQMPASQLQISGDESSQAPQYGQMQNMAETLEALQIEVRVSAEQISVLTKQIEDLKQGTMI